MSKTVQKSTVYEENSENDFQDINDKTSYDKQNIPREATVSKIIQETTVCGEISENDFQEIRGRTSYDQQARRREGLENKQTDMSGCNEKKVPFLASTSNIQQHEKSCDAANTSARDGKNSTNQPSSKRRTTVDKPNANTIHLHGSNNRPHNSLTSISNVEKETQTDRDSIDRDNELGATENKRKQKPWHSGFLRSKCYPVALVICYLLCIALYVYLELPLKAKSDITGGDGFADAQIRTAEFSPQKNSMNTSATNIIIIL